MLTLEDLERKYGLIEEEETMPSVAVSMVKDATASTAMPKLTLQDLERKYNLTVSSPSISHGGFLGIAGSHKTGDLPSYPPALSVAWDSLNTVPESSPSSRPQGAMGQDASGLVDKPRLALEDLEGELGLLPRTEKHQVPSGRGFSRGFPRGRRGGHTPESMVAERYQRLMGQIPRGFAQSVSGFIRVGDWLFESGKMKEYADRLDSLIARSSPEDPDYWDHAASGLGSMIFYLLPGIAATKGVSVLFKVAPWLARIAGGAFSGGFEALNNAAGVFRDVLEKTGDRHKAYWDGWKAFSAEVPVDFVTSLPLFGVLDRGGALGRVTGSALGESLQETMQSAISQKIVNESVDWKEALYEGAVALPSALIMGGVAAVADPVSGTGKVQDVGQIDRGFDPDLDAEMEFGGGGADVEWPRSGTIGQGVEIDVSAFRPFPREGVPDPVIFSSEQKVLEHGRARALQLLNKKIEDPTGMEVFFAPGPDETDVDYARHLVAGVDKNAKPQVERARALYLVEEAVSDPDVISIQDNGRRLYSSLFRDDARNTLHQIIAEVLPNGRARMVTSYVFKDDARSKNKAMKRFNKIFEGEPVYVREGIIKERADGGSPHAYQKLVSPSEPGLPQLVDESISLQQRDVNSPQVDREVLAQAIREAGGLNWDSMEAVYGHDFMAPLVKRFPSEDYPKFWRREKAGLRFDAMTEALKKRGFPIETPLDLHQVMAGNAESAAANIEEKLTFGFEHQDDRSLAQRIRDRGRNFYTHVFDREAPIERLVKMAETKALSMLKDPLPVGDNVALLEALRKLGLVKITPEEFQAMTGERQRKAEKYIAKIAKEENARREEIKNLFIGGKLKPSNNPYLHMGQLRNVHGIIGEDRGEMKMILGKLSQDDHKALSRLLVAYRTLDQRNLGIPTKVSPGDALIEINNAPPKLKHVQQELVQYQKKLLWRLVESGHLSYAGYQTMISRWPNYAPFFLDGGQDFMEAFNSAPSKIANDKNLLKMMEGTEEAIHDPLESMLKNTSTINRMIRQNQVARDLMKFSKIAGMEEVINEIGPTIARRLKGVVTVWDKGKRRYLKVLPDVFNVLEQAPGRENIFLNIMRPFSRTLRATAVEHNPMFLILNPVRDAFTVAISSETGLMPLEAHLKGLRHILTDSDLYREALKTGALGGHFIAQDKKSLSMGVREMFAEGQAAEKNKKMNPLRWLGKMNELLEQAPRVAEYASMRGEPSIRDALYKLFGRDFKIYSTEEASQAARDVSVDFSRFGESTRAPNDVIAFFNAALQGGKKIKDLGVRHPVRTFTRGVLWISLPSMLLWLRNRDEPWYQELPQIERDRWWHFRVGNRIHRMIKPFEMGQIFGSLVERSLERFAAGNPRAFKRFEESIMGSLGPAYLPTMFGPIIEWQTNYNLFRDRPVVPMREQSLKAEYQFGPETSEVAKWIGGKTGISPRKIDNTIYGYTSKLGSYATQLVDLMAEKAGVRAPGPREWTFGDIVWDPLGTLQKAFSRQMYLNPQSIEDFYEDFGLQSSLYRSWKASGKEQEGFNPLRYELQKRIASELSDVWAARRGVLSDDRLTTKQKQEAVERLNFLAMNLARLGTGKTILRQGSDEQMKNPFVQ